MEDAQGLFAARVVPAPTDDARPCRVHPFRGLTQLGVRRRQVAVVSRERVVSAGAPRRIPLVQGDQLIVVSRRLLKQFAIQAAMGQLGDGVFLPPVFLMEVGVGLFQQRQKLLFAAGRGIRLHQPDAVSHRVGPALYQGLEHADRLAETLLPVKERDQFPLAALIEDASATGGKEDLDRAVVAAEATIEIVGDVLH